MSVRIRLGHYRVRHLLSLFTSGLVDHGYISFIFLSSIITMTLCHLCVGFAFYEITFITVTH